ncbi:LacI family DNA-binding transcriptional regulator [Nakamurella endophytica]|uniref:LacI family transcriptional regulator n=1 Tax=Nakamurella endophytica TaxID=1748367 RepID=A0A917T3E0_9ACTN|nr:LacI family DNA-binding transcriptional regulator [Nakamurella endophytica]GGM08563.1 LacI family transcriptional regulator [Nakamurella endophytica]
MSPRALGGGGSATGSTALPPDPDRMVGAGGIVEVAALAGVSPATVSRALRGLPGVSASTRAAVRVAAEQLGYVASASASALARGRTSAVGVLAPWISRWFFAAVIEGAQELITSHGYDMLLYPLGANAGPDAGPVDARALHKRVDGVLGLNVPASMPTDSLRDLRVPLVTVGSTVPGLSGVQVDDVRIGLEATRHLLGLGHSRIGFLGLDPDDLYGFTVAADRHRGYVQALEQAGIEPDPRLTEVTGWAVQGGEAGLGHQLELAAAAGRTLPTAFVAVSDEVAMGALYAARCRGIRVPQDLSVIGVDDHDLSYLFDLTTVSQPVRRQGRLAAELLLEQMEGGAAARPRVVQIDPGLVVRSTTGPPRD